MMGSYRNLHKKFQMRPNVIPHIIWRHFFYKTLDGAELKLLQDKPKKLHLSKQGWDSHDRDSCIPCLCILYGHPKISAADFLKLFDTKRTTIDAIAKASVLTNRLDILRLIKHLYIAKFRLILEHNDFNILMQACQFAAIGTVKYLLQSYTGDIRNALRASNFNLFYWALKRDGSKGAFFKYLLDISPELSLK